MNGQVYLKGDVLLDLSNQETIEIGNLSDSAGVFLLQHNYSFNETGLSSEAGSDSSLSAEQQQPLTKFVRTGDPDTQQNIIIHNQRMMINIARHYANRGVTFFDLVREGNLGLTHALETFEIKNGLCFSRYATQCIAQYIKRAIMKQNNSLDSFKSQAAHLLTFDNPAHQRLKS